VTTGLIGSLNAFTEIFSMAEDGGPTARFGETAIGAARVSGYHLYRVFSDNFYGEAAALSFCLLLVALVVSAFNFIILTPRD
jgi:ABC-type sugar transport system permease subunit